MKSDTPIRHHAQAKPKHPHKANRADSDSESDVEVAVIDPTRERMAREQEAPLDPGRGNGHSSNPHGRLSPTDYGVHSHPCTTKLLNDGSGKT